MRAITSIMIIIIIIIIILSRIQRVKKTCFTFSVWFKMCDLADHISEMVKDPFTFNLRAVIYVTIFPNLSSEKSCREITSEGSCLVWLPHSSSLSGRSLETEFSHMKAVTPRYYFLLWEEAKSHVSHHPHPSPPSCNKGLCLWPTVVLLWVPRVFVPY